MIEKIVHTAKQIVNAVVDIHRARCDSPASIPIGRLSFIVILKRFGLLQPVQPIKKRRWMKRIPQNQTGGTNLPSDVDVFEAPDAGACGSCHH
ncbi:hypothetical protein N8E89_04570 [Phyllobacterium sp. A18/5-2]|uniref:hypothetical protein n=1 Tax=Phyllobacterium sp. A18/5-2 TaxID=2978392 RepID=UPI0013AFA9BB|nr:hypothetical protein [Phyllobacterium sp. A18/5-2]UXN65995.1 hypothetical protein N8E89_04570 [Phyllobacterium sp. A18/5-2]